MQRQFQVQMKEQVGQFWSRYTMNTKVTIQVLKPSSSQQDKQDGKGSSNMNIINHAGTNSQCKDMIQTCSSSKGFPA